jgi:hypothetical protein
MRSPPRSAISISSSAAVLIGQRQRGDKLRRVAQGCERLAALNRRRQSDQAAA